MNQRPEACHGCPAHEGDHAIGFVPPWNPTRPPRFAFIGQGPGEQEAIFSTPFYPGAPSGRMLRGWIHDAGMDPREVAFGNVVQCWLPKVKVSGELGRESREPTPEETAFCYRVHVEAWLRALPETCHLVAVGAAASRFLLGLEGAVEHLNGVTHFVNLPEVPSEETQPVVA